MEEARVPAVYVVKTTEFSGGPPVQGVFDELRAGRARIGWSYEDRLDLRLILQKEEQLDEEEQDARLCLGFLTRPVIGDYLIYPHQPARRQFCVVEVTGEYDYSTTENGIKGDFRSFRPCSLKTIEPVDWDDEIVPSQLRRRIGKPRRFSKISDTRSFFECWESLSQAGHMQDGSNQAILNRIHKRLRERLPGLLCREFSGADLSRRFCPDLFERMGYTSDVQEGPAEAGSDIVVTVGSPLLPDEVEFRIGVQVFAYEGTVEARYLEPN